MKSLIVPFINFSIFCGILIYVLRKPVKELLNSRSNELAKNLNESKESYTRAQQGYDEVKEKVNKLEEEKRRLETDTDQQIASIQKKAMNVLDAWLLKMKAEQDQRDQDELKYITQQLREEIANRIIEISQKMIHEQLTPKQQEGLVKNYVDDLIENESVLRKEKTWQNMPPNVMHEHS